MLVSATSLLVQVADIVTLRPLHRAECAVPHNLTCCCDIVMCALTQYYGCDLQNYGIFLTKLCDLKFAVLQANIQSCAKLGNLQFSAK